MVVLAVAAALSAAAVQDLRTPLVRWSQSAENLNLWLDVWCVGGGFTFTNDTLSLQCRGNDDRQYAIAFTLREDIQANASQCGRRGDREECVLRKRHAHQWDALATMEDQRRLKKHLKRQWKGEYSSNDVELVDDDEGDFYDGTNVAVVATGKKFAAFLKNTDFGVVDAAYPWCGHCRYARDNVVELARRMKKVASFIYVDPREVIDARRRFEPDCSHKCQVYVHRKGEVPYTVPYKHDVDEFEVALRAYGTPLLTTLKSAADVDAFRKKKTVCVVATARDGVGAFSEGVKRAAQRLRGSLSVGLQVTNDAPADGSIVMYKPEADKESTFQGDPTDTDAFVKWTEAARVALVQTFDGEVREATDARGLLHVELFLPDEQSAEGQAAVIVAQDAARQLLGEAVFVKVDLTAHSYMADDFGFGRRFSEPRLGAATSFKAEEAKRYSFDGELDAAKIVAWVRQVSAGEVRRVFRSSPTMDATEREAGQVQTVVGATLEDIRIDEELTFVVFYKSWMQNRGPFQDALDRAAKALRSVSSIAVAKMDTSSNYFDTDLYKKTEHLHQNPVGFLIGGGAQQRFAPKRFAVRSALKWLRKRVPEVESKWEAVAEELGRLEAEERAAREKENERAAAELRQLHETMDSVNITEDGGVVKFTRRAGKGEKPRKGDRVSVHYSGELLADGSETDSSLSKGKPFSFLLLREEVLPCWDKAVATMTPGEEAVLVCTAEYAFGDIGNAPKIPPGATLKYEMELISFERNEQEEEEGDEDEDSDSGHDGEL
eukprot:TRINITY_DN39415_c0_g1_i1.p1 TRINITY_DN39415_c0_g1~~TRINITY_DN39415_c0_g1_i1.p1  ORF type:complete len:794 (+),score=270.82 TRINITY_DN39415_c0_g1_i1:57-2384(+)